MNQAVLFLFVLACTQTLSAFGQEPTARNPHILSETLTPPAYNSAPAVDLKEAVKLDLRLDSMTDFRVKLAKHQGYTVMLNQDYFVFGASPYPTRVLRSQILHKGLNYGTSEDCLVRMVQTGSFASNGAMLAALSNSIEIPFCEKLNQKPRKPIELVTPTRQESIKTSTLNLIVPELKLAPMAALPTPIPTPASTSAQSFSDDLQAKAWIESSKKTDLTGQVIDVVSKQPIMGAEVVIVGQETKYHATTSSSGKYIIRDIPIQETLILQVNPNNENYQVKRKSVLERPKNGVIENQNFNLAQISYSKDRIAFVLTWEDSRMDLDSHLGLGTDAYVYFACKDCIKGSILDKDDIFESKGRETTLVLLKDGKPFTSSPYRFGVSQYQQFQNDPRMDFGQIKAKVEIYVDGELLATVSPPPSKDYARHWDVARIVDGKIIIKNRLIYTSNSTDSLYRVREWNDN